MGKNVSAMLFFRRSDLVERIRGWGLLNPDLLDAHSLGDDFFGDSAVIMNLYYALELGSLKRSSCNWSRCRGTRLFSHGFITCVDYSMELSHNLRYNGICLAKKVHGMRDVVRLISLLWITLVPGALDTLLRYGLFFSFGGGRFQWTLGN